MKSFDIHVYHTRNGLYKARITYSEGKTEYIGPTQNVGILMNDVSRHILLRERD